LAGLENGGLRCAFHGWLFDVSGQCLETPAEPKDSNLCKNITQRAYPVIEKSGILWAYLGEGEPPAFPEIDCFVAPDSHTFAFKGHINCNWLQALEVGIDPSHASFLHRFFEDEDTSAAYGKQFRGASAGSDMPMTKILREYDRPIINVEHTEYGLRLIALREIDDERTHVRHCERSEAIHGGRKRRRMDCFVASLLAMTTNAGWVYSQHFMEATR
jgi:phenylpropionate dioxygenase-like ring-hydroxylating dioxygenase large terminal subunit